MAMLEPVMPEPTEVPEGEVAPMTLDEIAALDNLVPYLDSTTVAKLGSQCKEQLQRDEASRKEWMDSHDKAMDLALQVAKKKDYPFENASNVIYPLITTAAIQFGARAYPAIVPGKEIVKAEVIGDDSGLYQVVPGNPEPQMVAPPGMKASRGTRVARWHSYQLLHLEPNWESDTDVLLHYLPIAGCAFRKRWWKQGSKSKWLAARDVVFSSDATSLESAPQITELFGLYPHEIIARARRETYDEDAVERFLTPDATEQVEFGEAHCRYDLDEDGYPEPYIVTFAKDSGDVVRIAANFGKVERGADQRIVEVTPRTYFIKYDFIPNPNGGGYGIGFGWLLGPINRSVNTAINQLFDAGNWQNSPSGFIGRRLRLKAGDTRLGPGEFKPVDSFGETIKNEIVTLDFPGPSPVMFQLLGLMIEAGKDVSSVKDIMLGDMQQNIAPTTMLALVEQGTKQFTAIYKRIHRALKAEMGLLYAHNREHLAEIAERYVAMLDDDEASPQADFMDDMGISPITDPDMVSEQAAMAKAGFLEALAAQGRVDPQESLRRTLRAARIEDPESLMPKQREPDPDVMLKMAKLENDKARIANDSKRLEAELVVMQTQAIKNLADAEAAEAGPQIEIYKAQVNAIKGVLNEIGKIRGMAAGAGDGSGDGGPSPVRGGGAGAPSAGDLSRLIPAGPEIATPLGAGARPA